ncbi:MAG: glycoside hydrolase family 97 catalytic domain-containing protein, partial [Bacteroidota bacterium]
MKSIIIFALASLMILHCHADAVQTLSVSSPDQNIEVKVAITKKIHYQVRYGDKVLTKFSPLAMILADGRVLGENDELKSYNVTSTDQTLSVTGSIRSKIQDRYNELTLVMSGNYQILFRVYDRGVAYRFVTDFKEDFVVTDEWVEYKFPNDVMTNSHIINTYRSSFEKHFTTKYLTALSAEKELISPPLMVEHDEGPAILLTEADQSGYPGILYRRYSEENIYSLRGDFAPYPAKTVTGGIKNFNQLVAETEPFIAKMKGRSKLPWRLMIIEEQATGLVDNTLVYQLATPSRIDKSWIQYGKVAWDWYNALNLQGVPFETGINTETYKYYIDFAARNNIEYIILDEGWSDQFDIQVLNEDIALEELIRYGKERNVGIILWAVWYPLVEDMDELFKWVQGLGAVGLKIDFFDRNDQPVMQVIEKMLKVAAKYELLIDFHGCPTLAGLERTYPNLVTYESVKGNEFVKWDKEGEPPYHNVGLAYTRNVVGPMDYTPGAMRNATQIGFSPNFESPMSKSTRAHQAGMYPVYFSPLQMLCDAPTAYEEDPVFLEFLADMPTTWD